MGRLNDHIDRFCDPPLDVALAELAAQQHGVVSLAQLRALGLGPRGVQLRAARGRLHRLHRGVYAVGHARLSVQGRRVAAVLACGPGAVLSHRTAADLWAIRRTDSGLIDVTMADRAGRKAAAGVRLHRVRGLAVEDVTRQHGLPVTTVARTLLDLADLLETEALATAVNEAEVRRLLDVRAVHEALKRTTGRRAVTRLRLVLDDPSTPPTRSVLEDRFVALIRQSGLPRPQFNAAVRADGS